MTPSVERGREVIPSNRSESSRRVMPSVKTVIGSLATKNTRKQSRLREGPRRLALPDLSSEPEDFTVELVPA
jgi:hypothetical protein